MSDRFEDMDVLLPDQIGGEGSDPGRAVKALASILQGKGGRRLMARAGDKLTITVEKNDRVASADSSFPALEWKAGATIEPRPATTPKLSDARVTANRMLNALALGIPDVSNRILANAITEAIEDAAIGAREGCADETARAAPGTPEALAALNWPGHLGHPGERVLLLAVQGFIGVGRKDAAERASRMADTCSDDAEAMRLLRDFRWNELADLPFPIREVLGFDKDGNYLPSAPDGSR